MYKQHNVEISIKDSITTGFIKHQALAHHLNCTSKISNKCHSDFCQIPANIEYDEYITSPLALNAGILLTINSVNRFNADSL